MIAPDRPKRAIDPAPTNVFVAPASFEQHRLWVVDQLGVHVSAYHMPQAYRVCGELDTEALQAALDDVASRHETLRTRFAMDEGQLVQIVAHHAKIPLGCTDLRTAAASEREARLHALLRGESRSRFNLSTGPLVRALLIRLAEREYVLLLTLHHIISDEWSISVLASELGTSYAARHARRAPNLVPLSVQYADYAASQRDRSRDAVLERQLAYWKSRLTGASPVLELPTDRPRPSVQSGRGAIALRMLPASLATAVHALARERGVSVFMTLLAAFDALLYRYTGSNDLVVGSPISTRTNAQLEGLIGFFVNTLALRVAVTGEETFNELLTSVRETALGAFEHADVPFDRVVDELRPPRDAGHAPYVNVMFVVGAAEAETPSLPGAVVTPLPVHTGTSKADLTLLIADRPSGLECSFEYNTDLFDAARIDAMLRHYENLLRAALADPTTPLAKLPILDDAERRELIVDWNRTERPYADDRGVDALVAAQAARTPDAIAVTATAGTEGGDARTDRMLTYRCLEQRAEQLAHALRAHDVARGEPVGVVAARDPESVVAMLGILKAGAAYVPLDPAYPSERLRYMLSDAHVRLIVLPAGVATPAIAGAPGIQTISSDPAPEMISTVTAEPAAVLPVVEPDDPAYIIYTSGSTGKPKGVVVSHRSIARLVTGTDYVTIGPTDVMAGVSTFSFDAATFEVWGALCNGARLTILPRSVTLVPAQFADVLAEHGVTIMFLTTALFVHVARATPAAFAGLRYLLFGGELLDPRAVEWVLAAAPPQHLVHAYGPTECTTFATTYRILHTRAASVPIGRPIANTEAYILDRDRSIVPVGVPGELYLGGPGLALRYLNDPELTRRKFVPHPFRTDEARLYATGDLVRYLPDGNIDFLGRTDRQVKIRGFRIELGELEAALSRFDGVKAALAHVVTDAAGEKRLLAYVAVGDSADPNASVADAAPRDLSFPSDRRDGDFYRRALATQVPRHLLPDAVLVLARLPLGPNGKIDPEALPAPPSAAGPDRLDLKNPTEALLSEVWERLLPGRTVGLRDDFFAVGGHSLLAARLIADVRETLGVSVSLAAFYENPTIEQLAQLVQTGGEDHGPLVALRTSGSRPPFFFLHGDWAGGYYTRELARRLPGDQPFYTLDTHRLPLPSIEMMASEYAALIRSTRPGPYVVGGFCISGLVAYEIAGLLRAAGETVNQIVLIDANVPRAHLAPTLRTLDAIANRIGLGERANWLRIGIGNATARAARMGTRLRRLGTLLGRRQNGVDLSWLMTRLRRLRRRPAPSGGVENLQGPWERTAARYIPRWRESNVALLLSANDVALQRVTLEREWRQVAAGLRVVIVPGEHLTCITRYVDATAAALASLLAAEQRVDIGPRQPNVNGSRRESP